MRKIHHVENIAAQNGSRFVSGIAATHPELASHTLVKAGEQFIQNISHVIADTSSAAASSSERVTQLGKQIGAALMQAKPGYPELPGGSVDEKNSQVSATSDDQRIVDNGKFGSILFDFNGEIKFVSLQCNENPAYLTLQDLLNGSKQCEKTGGPSRIFEKNGDFNDALRDCQSIGGAILKTIESGVAIILPDGSTGSVRKMSSHNGPDGLAPTLEIRNADKSKTKIRYRN